MSESDIPSTDDVEAIKERLKAAAEDVAETVDEAANESAEGAAEQVDMAEALRNLGTQFSDTIQKAWNSDERAKFEADVKEGIKQFGSEVEKGLNKVRENERASKAMDGTADIASRLGNSEPGQRARSTFALGLRKLSEGLGNLAEQFSEAEDSGEEAA